MKGLTFLPQPTDLRKAYEVLENLRPTDLSSLALMSQWSRFDPRLAQLLVHYLAKQWELLSPALFRRALCKQPWPSVVGVLLGAVPSLLKRDGSIDPAFKHWSRAVTEGLDKANFEQFFIGTRAIGGRLMRQDAAMSHKHFLKWGYLGRESFITKPTTSDATELYPEQRRLVLETLIKDGRTFTVADFLAACGHSVSRRQAERDIEAFVRAGDLRTLGATKGRRYVQQKRGDKI